MRSAWCVPNHSRAHRVARRAPLPPVPHIFIPTLSSSAPSYPNDPSIRRIFLAAPEERTPPPEVAAEVEVARLEAQLRQQEVRYDTLVAEQEAADRSAVAAERAKRTAEDNLRTSERSVREAELRQPKQSLGVEVD